MSQTLAERARSHVSLEFQEKTITMNEIATITHDAKATRDRTSRNFIYVSMVGLLQI